MIHGRRATGTNTSPSGTPSPGETGHAGLLSASSGSLAGRRTAPAPTPAPAAPSLRPSPVARRLPGLDWFERLVLLAFVVISAWVLGLDLWQVVVHGRVWTGTDGLFITDQMQYLAWIQSAARHGLVSDLFVLHATTADYLQPLVAISGALTALGLAAWLALLIWQPVAVVGMFFAVRAFVRRSLPGPGSGARRAALAIGLFGGSLPAIGDAWPAFWSWGYAFALIAIAALTGALLSYERTRSGGGPWWSAPALGALASWMHPWQGETLAVILVASELLLWLRAGRGSIDRRGVVLLAGTVLATVLPLLYYVVLAHADPQWGLARVQSKHGFPLGTVLLALAPFLLASALAYRRWPADFLATATRIWPLAALVVFVVSETGLSATPLHALAGITIPLAVLSVQGVQAAGWRRLPGRRVLGPVLVAAATIPTTVAELRAAPWYITPSNSNGTFITKQERRALRYIAHDRRPGGVLASGYLGLITPAETGRNTYLGSCQWSQPNCSGRQGLVQTVFVTPGIAPHVIRVAVLGTGARFVLASNCVVPGKDLDDTLAPITQSLHRFGCATVYEIADR